MLVDSHCHLDFPEFAPELDAVVARAREAGVKTCVSIGTTLEKFPGVMGGGSRLGAPLASTRMKPWSRNCSKAQRRSLNAVILLSVS